MVIVPDSVALFVGLVMLVVGGVVSATDFVKQALTTPTSGSVNTASVQGVPFVSVR
jgi:hypothetical protein